MSLLYGDKVLQNLKKYFHPEWTCLNSFGHSTDQHMCNIAPLQDEPCIWIFIGRRYRLSLPSRLFWWWSHNIKWPNTISFYWIGKFKSIWVIRLETFDIGRYRPFQEIFIVHVAKLLGVQSCVICIFLFLNFYNFIKGIMCIFIVFLKT